MICEKCGKELPDTAGLCTSCGWKTKNWQAEKQKAAMENNAVITALIACAVLVAVCFIFIFVLLRTGV